MATVCHPGSGRITASFGPVAVHHQVGISICPSRHAWRTGAVEKSAHTIAQRWWRTLPDEVTIAQAQTSLDGCASSWMPASGSATGAHNGRCAGRHRAAARAAGPVPGDHRGGAHGQHQSLISFRGNKYSVPPGHTGEIVLVWHKLGATTLVVATGRGMLLAHHLRQPDSAGAVVRADEHVAALTKVVLANFSDREPCPRKTRRPPSAAALAEAERIRRARAGDLADGGHVVVDFAAYAGQARAVGNDRAGKR